MRLEQRPTREVFYFQQVMAVMDAQMAALAAKRTSSPVLPATADWPYESHMDGEQQHIFG